VIDTPANSPLYGLQHEAASSPDRCLWVAVISNAFTDAFAPPTSKVPFIEHDRASSRAWFRIANPDFREVCFLAGLDPEAVIAAFNRRMDGHEAMAKAA
jgi:hypothetical protein